MNLFATALTYVAPSANYRGESAENRAVIQKITKGRFEYAIISPEAIRNALRETLRAMGLPCNRIRLEDEDQLAVKFIDYPDAENYADDFFMGWLIAATSKDREKMLSDLKTKERSPDEFTFKRDSIIRMNMAVALEPYRHDSVFTQSPKNVDSPWKNADSSQLLHRETSVTAYQYPFALNIEDCREKADWSKALLQGIGQLNGVAGNHARSYYEMAPASIVVRLTPQLVSGFDTYAFTIENAKHCLPEIIPRLLAEDDLPGNEFLIGGKVVRDLDQEHSERLKEKGVILNANPQQLLATAGDRAFSA